MLTNLCWLCVCDVYVSCRAPSSSMWLSNSPWCLMWDAYCNVLTARPVATKLATGMVGTFLGDMVAQAMQNILNTHASVTSRGAARGGNGSGSSSGQSSGAGAGGFQLDLTRTARLMGFSALVGTPVAFVWFTFLDQVCLHVGGGAMCRVHAFRPVTTGLRCVHWCSVLRSHELG